MKFFQYAISLIFLRHFAVHETVYVNLRRFWALNALRQGRSFAVHICVANNPAGSLVSYCHARTHSTASQKSGLNGLAHARQFCGATNAWPERHHSEEKSHPTEVSIKTMQFPLCWSFTCMMWSEPVSALVTAGRCSPCIDLFLQKTKSTLHTAKTTFCNKLVLPTLCLQPWQLC